MRCCANEIKSRPVLGVMEDRWLLLSKSLNVVKRNWRLDSHCQGRADFIRGEQGLRHWWFSEYADLL